jgi:hypothetical protein
VDKNKFFSALTIRHANAEKLSIIARVMASRNRFAAFNSAPRYRLDQYTLPIDVSERKHLAWLYAAAYKGLQQVFMHQNRQ